MLDWINELQQNPERVIAKAYQEHRPGALVWLMKNYNLEKQDALDVFQNSITALYQNAMLDKINNRGVTMKTYLFAICKNLAIKYKSKNRVSYFETIEVLENEVSSDNYKIREDQIKSCLKGIQLLSNACRKLLRSFYLEQRKIPEIAIAYNYSNENSAKTQKYKCLKKLRDIMITSNVV